MRFQTTLVLVGGVAMLFPSAGFSATIATQDDGTPASYAPVDLQRAQQDKTRLKSVEAPGESSPSTLPASNAHRAILTTDSNAQAAPRGRVGKRPPLPPGLLQPVSSVIVQGVSNGKETITLKGTALLKTKKWTVDCGVDPQDTTVVAQTQRQVTLQILPNLLDRGCVFKADGLPDANGYTLKLPGLTCDQWKDLCPAATVGAWDGKAADGSLIHIDIRNGPKPADVFTPQDIAEIKEELASFSQDQLKDVHAIQYKSDLPTSIYDGDAGNGGVVYIGNLPAFRSHATYSGMEFPIGYGVGALKWGAVGANEVNFWKAHPYGPYTVAKGFGIYYMDWAKGTSDFYSSYGNLNSQLRSGRESAANLTNAIQVMLAMGSHFYNPVTKQMYSGPYYGYSKVSFTTQRITVGDIVLYLDGNNNVIGQSQGQGPRLDYSSVSVPIPAAFLQNIPRT